MNRGARLAEAKLKIHLGLKQEKVSFVYRINVQEMLCGFNYMYLYGFMMPFCHLLAGTLGALRTPNLPDRKGS